MANLLISSLALGKISMARSPPGFSQKGRSMATGISPQADGDDEFFPYVSLSFT